MNSFQSLLMLKPNKHKTYCIRFTGNKLIILNRGKDSLPENLFSITGTLFPSDQILHLLKH